MKSATDVAAAIILRQNRVLVARRATGQKMAGLWEFPGGKVEPGESAQSCIVRELHEELAITGHAGAVLTTNLHHYPGGAINLIAVQFDMDGDSWQLSVHDKVEWVGLNVLLGIELAPADVPIAEYLCATLLRAGTNPE
ncbi:(deoxy)nucleoside triphosphate pyrophosphohydrolase [Novosphingobium acidiphilum]|uniref:(deoxy)nucleoside triphosphate pyrophosphohydrolase n=1 Tax=Novosphingobium acidiphilum TaxID=505248 RepID=UPI00048BFDFA|nr:(deoxy)nucleoside triphosphate pyrophosphohydrolase [Novosphingobium acidiphilum]